jgi:hypothetical protein
MTGDPACSAAVLHCLATAEKLPAINVGAMSGTFLQQAHAKPSLQEAAVGLALRHPESPGTGAPSTSSTSFYDAPQSESWQMNWLNIQDC